MKIPFEYCADDYDAYRPGYPSELYDFLVERCSLGPSSLIVDIGAGTGKGSAVFVDRGFRVVAVDAGENMLRRAPQTERVIAFAEAMPLDASAADLVLCPQSFHWFATADTLRQFRRILKTSGHLALAWNTRDAEPHHQQEYERLIKRFNPGHDCAYRNKDWTLVLEEDRIFRNLEHESYSHTQPMSLEDWKGLARSTSYIRSIGEDRFQEFEKELGRIMEDEPVLDMQCTTSVWLAEPVRNRDRDSRPDCLGSAQV